MKNIVIAIVVVAVVGLLAWLVLTREPSQQVMLAFSGGPEGGTFQYFSNGMATRLSKQIPDLDISNTASAGSVENLRRVNSGEADLGIVYSGDVYLGREGKLPQDDRTYRNVHALAFLYGAPAHLLVLRKSEIQSLDGLVGQRVAVGDAGSGAAAAAQRYFTTLGLWEQIRVEYIGYSQAASALGDGLIDAMWVFAGFPNASVIQAAATNPIRLLDLVDPAQEAGFFEAYPCYTTITIPGGTYSGVDDDVQSFQDAALWVAGAHVSPDVVYRAVSEIFSEEGLAYMVRVRSTARAMSVEGALTGIVTPVHEGAERYWVEQGLELTPALRAR
jgi:TRAP transporter TAXI family solute receptor